MLSLSNWLGLLEAPDDVGSKVFSDGSVLFHGVYLASFKVL